MSIIHSVVFLGLLGLLGSVLGAPVSACDAGCIIDEFHQPDFRHISELGEISSAPWELKVDVAAGREPAVIQYAACKPCSNQSLEAKAILLEVSVFKKSGSGWCRCPYQLAVGCTCVHRSPDRHTTGN